MKLTGNKVILRTIEGQDEEMLSHLMKVPEAAKMTGGYVGSPSCIHHMDWFRSLPDSAGNLRQIIAEKERPQNGVGIIILSDLDDQNGTGEIYIKLLKSVRGRGYGRDAVNILVSYGFCQLGLKYIYSNILEHNTASRRLFEACGFQQEAVYKSKVHKDGHCENICSYGKWAAGGCEKNPDTRTP